MTADPRYETVPLAIARQGRDLWSVIEAAQYARMDHQEEPSTSEEEWRIEAFLTAFEGCAESWDELAPEHQMPKLDQLGALLRPLEDVGLHVHVGTIARAFEAREGEPIELPIAIVSISRTAEPHKLMTVPRDLHDAGT